jgi:acyl-coenzyme A thioesterase PaaI-like protein
MDAAFYARTTLTPEEAAEHDRVLGALTRATRQLADAQLRTTVDLDEAAAVTKEIETLAARLLEKARDGALGTELGPGPSEVRNHGNAVMGLRNPFASIDVTRKWIDEHKHVHAELNLGALYEGPPGLVHGGVSALILDQMLGEAAAVGGGPGMTGRLTLHYRRPTPLGELSTEAWLESTTGRKTIAKGQVCDKDGNVTVEAEGLFILPRWATEHPEWTSRQKTFE